MTHFQRKKEQLKTHFKQLKEENTQMEVEQLVVEVPHGLEQVKTKLVMATKSNQQHPT